MRSVRIVPFFVFGIFVSHSAAFAKITINPDFKGTLVITDPEGEINLVEAGEAVPEIKSKSQVEVFDGSFTLASEAGDEVELICLDYSFVAEGGAGTANLVCGEETGTFKSVKGTYTAIDGEGKESKVVEGTEFPMTLGAMAEDEEAEPTAAAEELGTPPAEEFPEPDTRSIEASPSS